MTSNHEQAVTAFKKYKLKFEEKPNNQITVKRRGIVVDFWPNTGTWRARTGGKSQGLNNLLTFLFKPEKFSFEAAPVNKKGKSSSKSEDIAATKQLLDEREIPYRTMTPYQVRITFNGGFVDLWPSSKKWSVNGQKSEQGVESLFEFLNNKVLGE